MDDINKHNQELLNKFRPKEYTASVNSFEQKVKAKSNEPIGRGTKITYAQLHEVDEMAKRSIAESRERRRKITAVEKKKAEATGLLIRVGIGILAAALTAALVSGPGEGQAFDHNGDLVNIEEVYNPGR